MSLYFSMQPDKPLKFKPPPSAEATKEAVAALKAELEMELHNIKQCAYKPYECTQLTLESSNYCQRHILQDKSAPYKQCAFVFPSNGKRCHLPAPKEKKDSAVVYCTEHALKSHLTQTRRITNHQPPRTAEVLVQSVSHYIRRRRAARTSSSNTQHSDEDRSSPDENDGLTTKCNNPFVDIDSNAVLASGSRVLNKCSDSESDVDATCYGGVWQDSHADSSDNESIDSEQEDVLKHANIYSAEEVTLITRDKLIRLQSLYIDQFRYLTHMLRERRRQYLYALKREKETYSSIYNQQHDTPKEQRMYKKLKAYNSYHKKHGTEAVCNKRLHERRVKATEGVNLKPQSYSKCVFTEGGVKCGERALPVTRHCRKHILEDPNQILFRACRKTSGDIECTTPVEAIFKDATCRLHLDIPPIHSYSHFTKDSESDYDDTLEAHGPSTSSAHMTTIKLEKFENPIKSELMDVSSGMSPMIKEEIIENNSLDATSNMIGDVEMPLGENIDENKQQMAFHESDICIGFPKNDFFSSQMNDTAMDNLVINVTSELPEDSILNTEQPGDSIIDPEPSTDSIISSEPPTDSIITQEPPTDLIMASEEPPSTDSESATNLVLPLEEVPAIPLIASELPGDDSTLPPVSITTPEIPLIEKMDVTEEISPAVHDLEPSASVSTMILPPVPTDVPPAEIISDAVVPPKEKIVTEIKIRTRSASTNKEKEKTVAND